MMEKLMTEVTTIAQEENKDIEEAKGILAKAMERLANNGRKKSPPPPEGGISIRVASRKYGIPHPTLSVWVNKKGYVPIILRTQNALYVDEGKLAKIIELYKRNPGQGKLTIKKYLEEYE